MGVLAVTQIAATRYEMAGGAAADAFAHRRSWFGIALVYAFIIGLVMPIESSVFVGPMRLSPYRIVLLVALLPVLLRVLLGRAGGLRGVDILIILHAAWAVIALVIAHGLDRAWELAGIYVIETLCPYFLARCYIRSAEDFESFIRFVLLIVVALVPIALYESITGDILRNPLERPEPRLGLHRAFGPFEHPILYGTFCASLLGLAYYALKGRISNTGRLLRCGAIGVAVFLSLSSGPLTALVAQLGLIAWNRVMRSVRHRWMLLGGLFTAAWFAIDLLSNRTPIHVFITYFTFNLGTAYNRILIWEYGTAEVARNPLFGIGINEWQRPYWMSDSMDNFWLVEAVRYGLPALLLLAGAIVALCIRIGRSPAADERFANCRAGWLVTMVGLFVAGSTVHYWNAMFCFLMFLMGSGGWLAWPTAPAVTARPKERIRRTTRPGGARPRASSRPTRPVPAG